ncbi:Transposon Tf2-6 poly, partial [Paramuricea clavata]
ANGKIERFHRSLKNSIRSRLDGRPNWLKELPWALMGLRNSPNTDSGVAPSEIVFGKKLRLPLEPPGPLLPIPPSTFVEHLRSAVANQLVKPPQWHSTSKSRKENVPKELNSCKKVLIQEERKLPGLRPKFQGPFEVLERSNKTLKVRLPSGEETVSLDRTKPFFE